MAEATQAHQSHIEALHRLFGRGSVYAVGTAVQLSMALLVVPILTRILSAAQYGEIAAAFVVLMIVSMVGSAGLPDAAARRYFQGLDGPTAAKRLVVASVVLAAVAAVVADRTGPLWAGVMSLHYSSVLRWAVVTGALTSLLLVGQALLRAADRPWSFLAVLVVSSVVSQGVGLALTITSHSPSAYVAGLAIGTAAAALLAMAMTGAFKAGLPTRSDIRTALALGLPLVPHGLAQYMIASADRVAIAAILGLAAAGRYQVTYAVGSLGVVLIMALNQAWLPLLLGTPIERRWRVLAVTSEGVHHVAAVVAGLLALGAPLALIVVAPASFARNELVPVSAIVAFSILPYATACAHFHAVFLVGKTKLMAVAAPLAAAVNIAVNIALLPVMGLLGAAIATVCAYAVLTFVGVAAARRHVELPAVLSTALACWAWAVPFVAAGALLPPTVTGALLRALLGLLLVVLAARNVVRLRRRDAAVVAIAPFPKAESSDGEPNTPSPAGVTLPSA